MLRLVALRVPLLLPPSPMLTPPDPAVRASGPVAIDPVALCVIAPEVLLAVRVTPLALVAPVTLMLPVDVRSREPPKVELPRLREAPVLPTNAEPFPTRPVLTVSKVEALVRNRCEVDTP